MYAKRMPDQQPTGVPWYSGPVWMLLLLFGYLSSAAAVGIWAGVAWHIFRVTAGD